MGKKVKVKSVTELDPNSRINPILVNFEHAAIKPPSLTGSGSLCVNKLFGAAVFQSEAGAGSSRDMSHLRKSKFETQSRLGNQESKGTKRKQVVALQNDNMTYLGTKGFDNPLLLSSSEEKMKTYIALKLKKKLRIFEVSPITVSPYLEGHSHVVEDTRVTGIVKTREERREMTKDLVKSFGSKRQRVAYERVEKNQIDNRDMQQSIDAAVGKLEVPTEEPEVKDDSLSSLVPPCYREAPSAQDVYRLEDLITAVEMEAMDEVIDGFLNASSAEMKEWKLKKRYSDYFLAMWAKLIPKREDPRFVRKAKIVLYTEALISFLKLKHHEIRKKNIDFPKEFPLWMREKITDTFTTLNANGSRNRSDSHKDKTACYIMVLVLLANDLQFDVSLMSLSLNIHINKLLALARAVGITIIHNPTTKEYKGVLKMPLPKPIQTRGRKRKPIR